MKPVHGARPSTTTTSSPDAARSPVRAVTGVHRADDIDRLQRAAERASALQHITEALARSIEYDEVLDAIRLDQRVAQLRAP